MVQCMRCNRLIEIKDSLVVWFRQLNGEYIIIGYICKNGCKNEK